jgi:lipoate-protein ligase A
LKNRCGTRFTPVRLALVSRTNLPVVNRRPHEIETRSDLHAQGHLCENHAMQRLSLTLDTPAENLALDEALLDTAEATGPDLEILRLWESPEPVVVLGRSSPAHEEVDLPECERRGIPVLRRSSGGAAIVAGPGCLMYAVVLSYTRRPEAAGIHQSHAYVLDRIVAALKAHDNSIARAGTSDLVLAGSDSQPARKFSGNSLRVKRTHFLYHGTLLYDFDLSLIAACLRTAPRQPKYRLARNHSEFVANLPLTRTTLEAALSTVWPTDGELVNWPQQRVTEFVRDRYRLPEWNLG